MLGKQGPGDAVDQLVHHDEHRKQHKKQHHGACPESCNVLVEEEKQQHASNEQRDQEDHAEDVGPAKAHRQIHPFIAPPDPLFGHFLKGIQPALFRFRQLPGLFPFIRISKILFSHNPILPGPPVSGSPPTWRRPG